jgi:hypothetical protein
MTRFNMMRNKLRFGAFVRGTGRGMRAHVALFVLLLAAGSAYAADAAHARPHRGVQSAGVVPLRGKMQQAAVARRGDRRGDRVVVRDAREVRGSRNEKSFAVSRRGERANVPVSKARGRSRREVEVVARPVVMSRAAARRERRKDVREQAEVRRPVPVEAPAIKKSLTVDDFVRAANGSAAPAAKSEIVAEGVSQPDENERIATNDAPVEAPKAKVAVVQQKPAPVVRAAAPVVVSDRQTDMKPAPVKTQDVATAAGVSFDDAPASADLPHQRVVQGFGAEVAAVPATPRTNVMRKATPEDLGSDDRALQRELTDDAVKPMVVPLYSRSGHLMVPPPLKGTREILVHQNQMADQEGLSRIQDDADLDRMRAAHLLLPLPETEALDINDELPYNRRCARPWTVKFVGDISRAFYARFREPLRLSSAVRTVDFQLRLQRVNGNAASVDGDTASPHLTGQAIDFGKGGMSREEIAWMRAYLMPIMSAGKIDVEEEFQQTCFHISVYAGYAPKRRGAVRTEIAMRQ